jgi:hypothetical protein
MTNFFIDKTNSLFRILFCIINSNVSFHTLCVDFSILDAEKAQKQRSLLFKELNKCLMIRVSSCSEDLIFAEKLAFLALHQCALSSLNDNFCKVGNII